MTASPPSPAAGPRDAAVPFQGLTPDVVLDALDGVGLRGDGRMLQLNSYENRVFQVFLEDGRVLVAKFYRPGRWTDAQILEEHALAAELAADECPVVAPWPLQVETDTRLPTRLCVDPADAGTTGAVADAAQAAGTADRAAAARIGTLAEVETAGGPYRFAVAERRAGRAPELEDPGTLAWIGRLLGRMHRVGARQPFAHRGRIDVATLGRGSHDWLLDAGLIPPDALSGWRSTVDALLDRADAAFEAAAPSTLRLHGDCHIGNILWTAAGPHFVDLDDCATGPAVQDLWMLLSGDRRTARQELNAMLSGYEQFMDFDDRELALVEPLRALRMIHHSAWLARRWDDPAFQAAFPWFGQPSYWAQKASELRELLAPADD